jgi:ornithine decarboxylase
MWNAGFIDALADIDYRISALDHPEGAPDEPVEICGPTCDSLDTLTSVGDPYRLPSALSPGDRVAIWSTGAYCSTNASVGFNGYQPINQHLLPLASDEFGA